MQTAVASNLLTDRAQPSSYIDRSFNVGKDEWLAMLERSATMYVGNLAFKTSEEQIHEHFSKCGEIKRIIMGLDKNRRTPCGFCFVEYYSHDDALDCLRYINQTKLDDRFVRADLDPGFREGRQFGRGRSGGQVRDEVRTEYDEGRGGWGPETTRKRPRHDTFQQNKRVRE